MSEIREALARLRKHFELLKCTGSQPRHLHFEDSDICCRSPFFSCRSSHSVLMEFVPEQFRSTVTPCRYIPLNEKGEGLEVLSRTRTTYETESAVTAWLSSMMRSWSL